ncbi:enolase-phosphatase E1-like isoform X2 [Branchiostoma lanceolatum]|uniref:enolase-phosphatase E1-like isoform X2 n=1 Tax=Branchiostoma lanceolatum TaxID=7740 RepID=UPI003454EC07
MPVDRKAERFVNRLAHKLNSDECATMGEAKFRAMFQTAVDDLPDNKKLKDFLVDNFDSYFNKLWRNVQGIPAAHEAVPGSVEHRYNLRAADGLRSALSWVGTLPQAEQMPHYLNLFQRWFPSAEGSDALLDNIISSKKDDLDCLVTLTQLLNLNKQAVALQKVASAFVRRLEEAYDSCLQEDKQERAAELREVVLRFLTVLDIQRNPAVKWEDPGYEDLVAAFVSLYVDLSLLVTRTQPSTDSVGKVSQSIGNCILVWLGHSPTHILDVLLQSEPDGERDGAILTPVYRRFLHTAPSPLTHQAYIRYICAVCKAREIIPQNSPTWKSLQKAVLSTPAPPSFLSWLGTCSAELMDQVPNTPKWRGSQVTQFIILEASQEFRENLLDLLTEGLEQSDSVESEVKVQTEDKGRPSADTDLFFVDTSKDGDTVAQMGTDGTEVEHSGKEAQLLGEIHTLLGGIDVGQDMPEEREGSEESDVEEVEFQVPKSKAKRKEEVAEIVAQSLQTYRRHSVRIRAQEERDSTSGLWAVKSPVSPLQGRTARTARKDSGDRTEEQVVDVESNKLKASSEESMSVATGESVSEPQQMEVIKITSDDKEGDDEELVKHGRDVPKSVDKGQKKGKKEKGKKKSKKESKEGGSEQHDKLERSFEDIKCLEGESYDSSQESIEMMAFKATASELLQDVEKFISTTKEDEQELQVDMDTEESKTDTSEAMKEVASAENGEDNCLQAEVKGSEENQMKQDTESAVVECGADSGELSGAEKEEFQSHEGSPTIEEPGLADTQDGTQSVPDSQSDTEDGELKTTILKLRQGPRPPTSTAEPDLDQSEIIPLVVEGDRSKTGEEAVKTLDEEVVVEAATASITKIEEIQKESIFKTPASPSRGKSSPARANLSPSKASAVKTTGLASSPATRRRRLSTDDELHELVAEVTEKIAQDNSEDDVKSLAPATPPSKSADKRRRSTLGQSYGKYIEKQTFPDVVMEGTDTGDVVEGTETDDVVADQTEKSEAPDDNTSIGKESTLEHTTSKGSDTSKVDESLSETVCSDEEEEPSKTVKSSRKSAKKTKEREPTPMVKRERRKTSQQTLQPVGEEPGRETAPHSSDSSLSSNNKRKSLRRRKLDLNDEQEAEKSKEELEKQSGKLSEETAEQSEDAVLVLEDKESQETSAMEMTTNTETAVVERQPGKDEDDVAVVQPISDVSSEQLMESTGKKQGKVLRMVQSSPTPKRNKEEQDRIKLVSPQGSPELQFATSGHIVVRVSSDAPDHKPVIVQSPTGELIIKAYNPKVVVAPDLAGNAKRLDFDGTGTADKDGGRRAEGTGTKRDASSASLDIPKGKMVLRTRSKSPIASDSSSLTSVSSMSDTASGSRRKSRRSLRKVEKEPVVPEEAEDKDDEDLMLLDPAVPTTSGTRLQRSKVPRVILEDIGSQQTQVSDSDLSVSSQSSTRRRRSKAATVPPIQEDSDSQGTRRSSDPSVSSQSSSKKRRSKAATVSPIHEDSDSQGTRRSSDPSVSSQSSSKKRRSKAATVSPIHEDSDSQGTRRSSDPSVSSQSSSKKRRSKAATVSPIHEDSDSQGSRRSTRKRATGREKESPPKRVKTSGDDEGDEEKRKSEMESGPELIVLDSSPVKATQEDPPEAGGEERPVIRGRVKRETLSNASSMSDQSALDSEQEGSISARTRSSRKRRSEHAGKLTRSAVMAEVEAKKRLSML